MKALERLLVFSLLSTICAAYGQNAGLTAPPPTQSRDIGSPLNGNWHLTGIDSHEMGRSKFPFLAVSMKAAGDQLHGRGLVRADCRDTRDSVGGSFGSTLYLLGKIAPDGTFEARSDPAFTNTAQLTIHGTVPAPGAKGWSGTYTLQSSPTTPNCVFEQSSAFTATKYPPFTGTYSGSVVGKGLGARTTVTIQVTQGEPVPSSRGYWTIPLSGQIMVAGSSCFSTGTATTATSEGLSSIDGNSAALHFLMDDKSVLHLYASPFEDPKKPAAWAHVRVKGGQCDHANAEGVLKPR